MKRFLHLLVYFVSVVVLLSTQTAAAITADDVACAAAGGPDGTCFQEGCQPDNTNPGNTTTSVGSAISGDIKTLAEQILSNSSISFDFGPSGPAGTQFKRLAAGQQAQTDDGRQVDVEPILLVTILHMAQTHKVNISSLTDGASHTAPDNPHGSGKAVDINIFDGSHTNGSDAVADQITSSAAEVLPNGSRFGLGNGGGGTKQIGGKTFSTFNDVPNHVHIDVVGVSQADDDAAVAAAANTTSATPSASSGSKADGAAFPSLDSQAMAASINSFIAKENSKSELGGLGATIVASAKNSNINPFLIVAIAHKESNLSDPTDFNVMHGNNSFGREAAPGQPQFQGSHAWYKWSSVKASVDYTAPENQNARGGGDMATYLRQEYGSLVDSSDLISLITKYAPPSENNTTQYISDVRGWVSDMEKGALGVAPTSTDSTASTQAGSCSCSVSASNAAATSDSQLSGNDNSAKVFNYFVGPPRSLSPEQAAGIVGNFQQESGLNPSDTGGYLGQWGGGRLSALQALAQKENLPVTSLAVQLDYVWLELTGGPGAGENDSAVLKDLKGATNPEQAATIFSNEYERPGDPQLQNRIKYANNALRDDGSATAVAGTTTDTKASTGSTVSDCGGGNTTSVNCTSSNASDASGLSTTRQKVVCIAEQELALWKSKPGYPHPAFAQNGYLKYSENRSEEWCADFATWVYNQASDPLHFAGSSDWNIAYVPNIQTVGESNQNFHWHPQSSGYTPKPGDLAIHDANHVNIFISNSGNTATYIGGDQGSGPYPGGSIVSVESGNGYYDNGITGYVSPD